MTTVIMESEPSESNLVIVTRRDRCKSFCSVYWRTLVILLTPIILFPIVFISTKDAYKTLYIFLVTAVYWVSDVLHPAVIAIVPIAFSSLTSINGNVLIKQMYLRTEVIDCISVMMIMTAIEHSKIQLRIAIKILIIVGTSHYRLSFLLFFTTMFLSMWISCTLSCGLMMVVTKAVLIELEKMGVLELFETTLKIRKKVDRHEQSVPKPSKFTVFYFLGIAYSSTIGEMATVTGSRTNQIFRIYCEKIFPTAPKIEFPQFMLLNLPGVLVMETLLYLWMNFFFLGIFRSHSEVAIEVRMTEEEAQYVSTLLGTKYKNLGKFTFHEVVVATIVTLNCFFQAALCNVIIEHHDIRRPRSYEYLALSMTGVVCVLVLFLTPIDLQNIKFFRKRGVGNPLPTRQSKSCLNWNLVESDVQWSVPFILACTSSFCESFRMTGLTTEIELLLISLKGYPQTLTVCVVMVMCKILTEFSSNCSVVYAMLPMLGRASMACKINPYYLMMAGTLSGSLPFQLIPGSPVNAMVAAYVHISPWTMMYAGIGPSILALLVTLVTVVLWSRAIWTEIIMYPDWAIINAFPPN